MEVVARSGLCAVVARHYVEGQMDSGEFSVSKIIKPAIVQTTWLAIGTQHPASVATRVVGRLVGEIMREKSRAK